ncbi:MAG: IMPACT family protein [Lachnospiraceae bacterium]|jgi:uncharacterized YigZ family protein
MILTIGEAGFGEYEEKKSRFLAEARHVECREDAEDFLAEIRKKYYDARHHCSAFVIRAGGIVKASDDGEPSQTAGRPILSVIEGRQLTDAMIVVTRYFGGTLLGTGGLVRSYTTAAQRALEAASIVRVVPAVRLLIGVSYSQVGTVMRAAAARNLKEAGSEYGGDAKLAYLVPEDELDAFEKEITEKLAGKADFEEASRLEMKLPVR